jgi:thiosulfate dehydrogenase [quinone] large subunit
MQAVLAYEWLVSGLDKLLDGSFGGQLFALLSQAAQDRRHSWFAAFLYRFVLPNHGLFAHLVPWSETMIGIALLLSATLWIMRPQARITVLVARLACLALLVAAALEMNYYLLGNGGLPWIDPANATTEGIDIDVMLPLISLVLFVANLHVLYQHGRAAPIDGGKSWERLRPAG